MCSTFKIWRASRSCAWFFFFSLVPRVVKSMNFIGTESDLVLPTFTRPGYMSADCWDMHQKARGGGGAEAPHLRARHTALTMCVSRMFWGRPRELLFCERLTTSPNFVVKRCDRCSPIRDFECTVNGRFPISLGSPLVPFLGAPCKVTRRRRGLGHVGGVSEKLSSMA